MTLLGASGLSSDPKGTAPASLDAKDVLSEREIEVLKLVAEDLSSKQIANSLRISERTVHQHLTHIYGKLKVSSRLGAVLRALDRGLLNLEDCRPGRSPG